MIRTRSFAIVASATAARRLGRAEDFLRSFPPHQPITIVAATRGAADDLARLKGPIGLFPSQDPRSLAVSALAEIVKVRASRRGGVQ